MYALLPVSDSGSRRRHHHFDLQYGGFDARTRFLVNLHTPGGRKFFLIPIGALRLSTMTFAHGSSLADAKLPSVWPANRNLPTFLMNCGNEYHFETANEDAVQDIGCFILPD